MTLVNCRPNNPFALARALQQDFDRMFNTEEVSTSALRPNIDVAETDQEIKIIAELPGLGKDDFQLEIHERNLVLKGEKHDAKDEDLENFTYRERRFGSFHRQVSLPVTADLEKIDAHYENGVLTITIPKKEESRPRQIPVNLN